MNASAQADLIHGQVRSDTTYIRIFSFVLSSSLLPLFPRCTAGAIHVMTDQRVSVEPCRGCCIRYRYLAILDTQSFSSLFALFFLPIVTMSNSAHGRWTASQPPPATSRRGMDPSAQTRNGIGRQPAQQAWQAPQRVTHPEPNTYHNNLEGRFDMNDLEGDFNFSDLDGAFNMNNPERSDNAHYLEATYPPHSGVTPMIGNPMIGNFNNEGGERPSPWTGLIHEQCCSDLDEAIEMMTDLLNKVKMTRKQLKEQDDTETDLQAIEEMKWGIQNLHRLPQEGRCRFCGRQELSRGMGSRPREL
ncbi:hypothetical protein EDB81DRAFT_820232 [Dactylonectria macrodidyma]|uniref:Uncharacterized protein n=1 Tax=Dactylonectria macrodidyma TaxID=307937 RepID=A0A9P9DAW9_9HYPO|nr:hypothetical protein EDB81DRAFT_820232 [Dactylonectria macrodidyma]